MTEDEREEFRRRSMKLLSESLQTVKQHGGAVATVCFSIIDFGDGTWGRIGYVQAENEAAKIVLSQFVKDSVTQKPVGFRPFVPTVPTPGGKPS